MTTHAAVQGFYGRMSAPPEGCIYVRNPEAARAKAIRDRLAVHQVLGTDCAHLEKLSRKLSRRDTDGIDLVDASTGEKRADVNVSSWGRVGDGNASGVPPR